MLGNGVMLVDQGAANKTGRFHRKLDRPVCSSWRCFQFPQNSAFIAESFLKCASAKSTNERVFADT